MLNFAGRSNWLQGKLKYVQCLAEFSVQHNVTRVCQFHPAFQKDANQVEWRPTIFLPFEMPATTWLKDKAELDVFPVFISTISLLQLCAQERSGRDNVNVLLMSPIWSALPGRSHPHDVNCSVLFCSSPQQTERPHLLLQRATSPVTSFAFSPLLSTM